MLWKLGLGLVLGGIAVLTFDYMVNWSPASQSRTTQDNDLILNLHSSTNGYALRDNRLKVLGEAVDIDVSRSEEDPLFIG